MSWRRVVLDFSKDFKEVVLSPYLFPKVVSLFLVNIKKQNMLLVLENASCRARLCGFVELNLPVQIYSPRPTLLLLPAHPPACLPVHLSVIYIKQKLWS